MLVPEKRHIVKLIQVNDRFMCSVNTLRSVLSTSAYAPNSPLLVWKHVTFLTQTMWRKKLTSVLNLMQVPLIGVGFHTFRRSAATFAFEARVPVPVLQMHGVWHSDAIWSYMSYNTSQSLQVPLVFQSLVNSLP